MSIELTVTDNVTWFLSGQLKEDEPVRTIRINSSPFSIGRRNGTALTIDSPSVSGRHAELMLEDGNLFVRDLGSTNGTFVNGMRISSPCKVKHGDLVQFAQIVFRAGIQTELRDSRTIQDDAADRALALIQFDKLMTERAVTPHFQPIVEMQEMESIGYELLGRSRLFGLTSPAAMFSAAAVLDLEAELSRILRYEGIRCAGPLGKHPLLFVNTHPAEMAEPGLLEFSLRELRELAPESRIVLEIHEAAVTVVSQMRELRAALKDMDIGLAYDDFGAGQARLIELVEVPPDFLKFDINLIRNIQNATADRQKMLGNLVQMVRELGIAALAEGIEMDEEHEVCKQVGFEFAQGYLYGKPALPKSFADSATADSTESTIVSVPS
jgi:EAL domain-containing protein (putative c-di-GMP-specific phosphodiesterase class I)